MDNMSETQRLTLCNLTAWEKVEFISISVRLWLLENIRRKGGRIGSEHF